MFRQGSELTAVGLGFPQYSNDDVVIPALRELGYAPEDAVDYTVAACWEFIIPGVGADVANIGALSLPKVVNTATHRNLLSSNSFEKFMAAVQAELNREVDEICGGIQDLWFVPGAVIGLLTQPHIDCGGKTNNFGIHGSGLSNAADSLAAIKKYVYEERTVDKNRLLRAMDTDFQEGNELLHLLRYETPKNRAEPGVCG